MEQKNIIDTAAKVLLIGGLTLSIASCTVSNEDEVNTQLIINASFKQAANTLEIQVAQKAFADYLRKYGCIPEEITLYATDYSSETVIRPDGGTEEVIERAEPKKIVIDTSTLGGNATNFNDVDNGANIDDLADIVIHALTHACQNDKVTRLEDTFELDPGYTVTGSSGFRLQVLTPTGETTQYTTIEEGVSEALAAVLKPDYSTPNSGYFNVGRLSLKIFELNGLSAEEVSSLIQNGDLKTFVNRIFNTDTFQSKYLYELADIYNDVMKGHTTPDQGYIELLYLREEEQ